MIAQNGGFSREANIRAFEVNITSLCTETKTVNESKAQPFTTAIT